MNNGASKIQNILKEIDFAKGAYMKIQSNQIKHGSLKHKLKEVNDYLNMLSSELLVTPSLTSLKVKLQKCLDTLNNILDNVSYYQKSLNEMYRRLTRIKGLLED